MSPEMVALLSALDYWVRILLALEDHTEGTFSQAEVITELRGITRAMDRLRRLAA